MRLARITVSWIDLMFATKIPISQLGRLSRTWCVYDDKTLEQPNMIAYFDINHIINNKKTLYSWLGNQLCIYVQSMYSISLLYNNIIVNV